MVKCRIKNSPVLCPFFTIMIYKQLVLLAARKYQMCRRLSLPPLASCCPAPDYLSPHTSWPAAALIPNVPLICLHNMVYNPHVIVHNLAILARMLLFHASEPTLASCTPLSVLGCIEKNNLIQQQRMCIAIFGWSRTVHVPVDWSWCPKAGRRMSWSRQQCVDHQEPS